MIASTHYTHSIYIAHTYTKQGGIMRSKYERITIRPKDDIILALIELLEERGKSQDKDYKSSLYGKIVSLKWVLSIDEATLDELQWEMRGSKNEDTKDEL